MIEIDGFQHSSFDRQKTSDISRDKALNNKGISVIRISAQAIRKQSVDLDRKIKEIVAIFDEAEVLRQVEQNYVDSLSDIRASYEIVLRFQFAILSLVECGALSLHDRKWTLCIDIDKREAFEIAMEDLFLWIENIFLLRGRSFVRPSAVYSENGIRIGMDIFGRPDDSQFKGICVFTDYWDDIDYYQVKCAELINYNIDLLLQPEKERALTFFLNNLFGYESFNPGQLLIIPNILNLSRTIGVLPTGGGKSLCYQLCTLLQPAISFSVCPITSLEIDQKEELDAIGFSRSAYIASTQDIKAKNDAIEAFGKGKYQIVWISPERFQSEEFRIQIGTINEIYNFAYAVIDEVHCLSEWGHDFRTSYLTLVKTIERYCPQATLVGLTATASQAVLKDLKVEFEIDSSNVKALPSLERKNLSFHVINTAKTGTSKNTELEKLLSDSDMVNKDSVGIIFTLYRDCSGEQSGSFRLLSDLRKMFPYIKSEKYHAGVSNKEEIQNRFKQNDINILSTTKAFGMGINKEDVRYTIHYELPWSVEAFYQEAGRAGRSTKKEEERQKADCYIIYTPEEREIELKTEELFKKDTSAEDIIMLQGRYKNRLNDVGKIFYLWSKNNKGKEADINAIGIVINKLNKKKQSYAGNTYRTIFADEEISEADMELALYRLRILNVIKDWTRDWKNKAFSVYLAEVINEETVSEAFYSYVRRHEAGWSLDSSENEQYKSIIEDYGNNRSETYIRRYAEALILWTYNELIYSRRRMIQTIREYCKNFTTPEEFKRRITNFLKITDQSVVLDGIAEETVNWTEWFDIFYERQYNDKNELIEEKRPKSQYGIEEIREACARYLESYRNSVGLNLIYILSGALTQRYDLVLDEDLLKVTLNLLDEKYKTSETEIVLKLIDFLKENKSIISQGVLDSIISCLLNKNRQLARKIYGIFDDRVSLTYIVSEATISICKAMEG